MFNWYDTFVHSQGYAHTLSRCTFRVINTRLSPDLSECCPATCCLLSSSTRLSQFTQTLDFESLMHNPSKAPFNASTSFKRYSCIISHSQRRYFSCLQLNNQRFCILSSSRSTSNFCHILMYPFQSKDCVLGHDYKHIYGVVALD